VIAAGKKVDEWLGKAVIVPAVIPCGRCTYCLEGHGGICPDQIMPGNDVPGGFASHVVVPALGLCPVPETALTGRPPRFLAELSTVADAISTPYQAILRSELKHGDLAIVVGVGGVGGFAVQIASALGATVVGIDIDAARLERLKEFGLSFALNSKGQDSREMRRAILDFVNGRRGPTARWKIFECSGVARGQGMAFGLLVPGAHLSIIGFTRDPVSIRLSNLMAFDARCQGNWGCLPEHYPKVLDLVLKGLVRISPFVEHHAMSSVNDVLQAAQAHALKSRPVLTP
jgi:6-hydroxycyclohex-1-ene-1-carbonyl-CoA dehydrogenase